MISPPPPPFMQVDCTAVRTVSGPSESFEVNVGFHLGVCITVVMDIDVISSEKDAIYPPSSNGTTDGGTVWTCN